MKGSDELAEAAFDRFSYLSVLSSAIEGMQADTQQFLDENGLLTELQDQRKMYEELMFESSATPLKRVDFRRFRKKDLPSFNEDYLPQFGK